MITIITKILMHISDNYVGKLCNNLVMKVIMDQIFNALNFSIF